MAYALLLIYGFLLFVRPMEWVSWMRGWPVLDFIVPLTGLVWLGAVASKTLRPRLVPQTACLFGLFAACLASHLFRLHPYIAGARQAFVAFGKIALLYLLVATLLNTPGRIRGYLAVIGLAVVFMSVHAIRQFHSPEGGFGVTEWQRLPLIHGDLVRVKAFGFFSDPNDLALILVAGLPFMVRAGIRKGASLLSRAWLLAIPPVLYTIYLTHSRGGWLALAVTVAAFVVINFAGGRGRRIALVVGAILLGLLLVAAPGRMGSYDAGEASAKGRWGLWGQGMAMFKSSPLVGVGMNRFSHLSSTGLVAHNSYVHCYAELGLFGYFFFLALILACLQDGYAMAVSSPGSGDERARVELEDLSRAAVPALVGLLAACFFLSRTYVHALYVFFGIFAAMRTIHEEAGLPADGLFSLKRHKWRVVAALVGSIAVIGLFTRVMFAVG